MTGLLEDIHTIDELNLAGRRVLLRLDLDVPVSGDSVLADWRLQQALPTIKKAQGAGARVVIASRSEPFGPPGKTTTPSLEAAGMRLSELLGSEIYLPDDSIGDAARKVVQDLRPGQICLLENLAFHPEDAANDEGFSRKLRDLADVYVNDAPRALARRDASLTLLARLFRERAVGTQLHAELSSLGRLRENVARPFVVVIGGARVTKKLELLESLLGRADAVLVGGVVGNTLLKARGLAVGTSPVDSDALARARSFLARAKERKLKVVLPLDLAVTERASDAPENVVLAGHVPEKARVVDVGPRTLSAFREVLATAGSGFCQGALGVLSTPESASGTRALLAALNERQAFQVLGGTSLPSVLDDSESFSKFGFISAAGDVSLDLLSGRKLPALEALRGGET